MDLNLFARCARILNFSRYAIIVVSASVFEQTKLEAVASGGDDFIIKPIRLEELLNCLHTHLPLEWLYSDAPQTELVETPESAGDGILPPVKELERLRDYARDGRSDRA